MKLINKAVAKAAVFVAASIVSVSALAFPIAIPGTEGLKIFATGAGPVVATYEGNSAGYSNDLYLGLQFIFNNHDSPVGSVADLGTFASGTELVFRLHVNNTGDNFYTGDASRNADGQFHARVQNNWKPGTTLVSFEDLWGTPEGQSGYNDLSFSFTNTNVTPVPEPETYGMMLAGLGLLGFAARRKAKKAAK